jgi:flagellum-specific peptidoglycan hydrolase FlgJ
MSTYRIQRGDTLGALAARFHTTVSKLAQSNGISNPNLIVAGHTLEVPGGTTKAPKKPVSTFHPSKPKTPSKPAPTRPGSTAVTGKAPKTGNAFLDKYGAAAMRSMQSTGVPASVTLAQAILESGWGRSGLTRKAFNFFGIKGTGPAGSVTVRTREVVNGRSIYINAAFKAYHNAAESFADHGKMLRRLSRYAPCFRNRNNPEQFCRELQKAGYATDPHYASALINIIHQYGLARFDH